MTKERKPEELKEGELDEVTGGASETPVAASRFGISVDGVHVASSPQLKAQLDADGIVGPQTASKTT